MLALALRRLFVVIPTLLLLSVFVFALSLQLDPTRAAIARAGGANAASQAAIDDAFKTLKLDRPVYERYAAWLGRVIQGDLGRSYVNLEPEQGGDGTTLVGKSVAKDIRLAFPRTLSLVFVATIFVFLIGLPIGIIGGTRPGSLADRFLMFFAVLGLAVPNFWVAMLLITFFAIESDLFPAVGYVSIAEGGVWGWLNHLILPGLVLAVGPAAVVARQLRSALADVMGASYIRTAWSKGTSLRMVVLGHALKNAAFAPLTAFALSLVSLLGGAVIIESLLGINGTGTLLVSAVRSNDVPMLQGLILLFAVFNIVINLVVDILYGYLNPKVRLQ